MSIVPISAATTAPAPQPASPSQRRDQGQGSRNLRLSDATVNNLTRTPSDFFSAIGRVGRHCSGRGLDRVMVLVVVRQLLHSCEDRLHETREEIVERAGVYWRIAVWRIGMVMMPTFASAGLQAHSQSQTAQSPGQANATAQNDAPQLTAFPTPPIPGPLQAPPAHTFEAGPFGTLNYNFLLSGIGVWQANPVLSDNSANSRLEDAKFFLQKTTSWWQFYVQAGAYNIPALGTPFTSTQKTVFDFYGPAPVAYLNFLTAKSTSIQIGSLPALTGAERPFDFRNMNVERGLPWNQENVINRGIQVNQTLGKFAASFSWNDGFYSSRYSWLSGSLTYTNGPHSVALAATNLGQTAFRNLATPVQNNSSMYAVIYAYANGHWIVQPYFQCTTVPTNLKARITNGSSTRGGAVLASRTFSHGFSLAGRAEYIASTGSAAHESVNLLYGPVSAAWSLTLTPAYQYKRFFTRTEFSFVQAKSYCPGDAFGPAGLDRNQPRGMIEAGFAF